MITINLTSFVFPQVTSFIPHGSRVTFYNRHSLTNLALRHARRQPNKKLFPQFTYQAQQLQRFTLGGNTANKLDNVFLRVSSKKLSQLNFSHQRFPAILPRSGCSVTPEHSKLQVNYRSYIWYTTERTSLT